VRRALRAEFHATPGQVVDAVRAVLSRHPYRDTDEQSEGRHFVTIIDPGWWVIPTPMSVEIGNESEGQVLVRAVFRSSGLFFIDPLDHSGRFIRRFFRSVAKNLEVA